jgi:hypothetical protein
VHAVKIVKSFAVARRPCRGREKSYENFEFSWSNRDAWSFVSTRSCESTRDMDAIATSAKFFSGLR